MSRQQLFSEKDSSPQSLPLFLIRIEMKVLQRCLRPLKDKGGDGRLAQILPKLQDLQRSHEGDESFFLVCIQVEALYEIEKLYGVFQCDQPAVVKIRR